MNVLAEEREARLGGDKAVLGPPRELFEAPHGSYPALLRIHQ